MAGIVPALRRVAIGAAGEAFAYFVRTSTHTTSPAALRQ